jgi:hypothetical protein
MATKFSVGRLVPSTIVLAVAGSCTWSTLSGPDSVADGSAGKLPEVTRAMLSPAIGAAPDRDPFKGLGEARPDVLAGLRHEGTTTRRKAGVEAGNQVGAGNRAATKAEAMSLVENERIARVVEALGDALTLRLPIGAPGTSATGARPEPKVDLAGLLARLDLNATWVQGPRRAAVINGRVYRPGEALEGTAGALVAEVLPGRVLLECQGGRAELTMPEVSGRPGAPAASPTGPRPAQAPSRRGGGARKQGKAR